MLISANLNLLYLSNNQNDLSIWVWTALALALIALICSLIALRRAKHIHDPVSFETSAVSTFVPDSGSLDPAIIAVLTAAVAMMLGDTAAVNISSRFASTAKSPTGFTIRSIRRV